ncbi:MAG: helix-turn-helix domain-containing protein [Dehalococcoidia bacterium]|nr:helix-turn-helix domain-containing protein [Dehalococcoidia bacterium]
MNINEAAKKLNVSTRTIRRHIKAGKIKAELIKGSFGEEYRILELPPQFDPNAELEEELADGQPIDISAPDGNGLVQGMGLIRELQEKNLALAAQLGAAAERIRHLESQIKLLAPPPSVKVAKESWWRRFQSVFTGHRRGLSDASPAAQASEEST